MSLHTLGYSKGCGSITSGPSPTQTGITTSCITYYEVEDGASCWPMLTQIFTYLNQTGFVNWN